MKVVSHRCNNLEDFKYAISLDVYGIEIDIHEVNDKFIVSHDPPITEILELSALVNLIKNTNKILFLEIKGNLSNILELKKIIQNTNVIVMSFNFILLKEFREYQRIFLTANIFDEKILELILEENFDYIGLDYIIANKDYIKILNKPIFVYTVNTKKHYNNIKNLIHGVITDTPNDL